MKKDTRKNTNVNSKQIVYSVISVTDNTTRRRWHYSLNRSETPITDNHHNGNESRKNTRDPPCVYEIRAHIVENHQTPEI